MKTFKTCCFCDIVLGKYRYTDIDEPFANNDEFVAVASIGALVEGWSLIIPKKHQLSMRNTYTHPVFADFVGSLVPPLVHQYGPLVAFEHGANKEGSITACGTNHAHLHLVPFRESLLSELKTSGLQWAQCRPSEIALRTEKNEYLFYCELESKKVWQDPVGYLHILERPLSQFFRRLIAGRSGLVEVSDYRRYPYLETAMATRRILAGSIT